MEMSIRFPHLNLEFDYVGKSFQIFGFEITIYGILIAVGMLLGIAFVVLEAKRSNQNQDRYLDMMILSLAAAAIGARIYYVAFSWELYSGNPMEIFNIRSGGSAFYGGLLGGILAACIFCRICRLSFWKMADTASMGILIGQIIGRWGNFFNRESFGEYTDSIFAMQLPISAVRSGEVTAAMRENLTVEGGVSFIQVSPVFLYESLWCLLLLLILLVIRRKKRFHGELFMRYLAGYGLGRFFFELLRTDKLYIWGTEIGISMVISAVLFIVFTPAIWVKRVMSKKRAVARRRRREKVYEAEERAYSETLMAEKKEESSDTKASSKEKEEADAKGDLKEQETPDENQEVNRESETENWETLKCAHIPQMWWKQPESGSNSETDLQQEETGDGDASEEKNSSYNEKAEKEAEASPDTQTAEGIES